MNGRWRTMPLSAARFVIAVGFPSGTESVFPCHRTDLHLTDLSWHSLVCGFLWRDQQELAELEVCFLFIRRRSIRRRTAGRDSAARLRQSLLLIDWFELHYRSKVWSHPDNFVSSMKTHFYLSNELKIE